jgi:hypothetical protein
MKRFRAKDGSDEPRVADHRPRRAALSQGQGEGEGGQAVLHRQCADREPQWAGSRGRARFSDGNHRTRGSYDDGGAPITGSRRLTLGDLRSAWICRRFETPHIARNTTSRTSTIDARTTRHPGYAISQQKRKQTEEPFGWGKTIGGLARPMLREVAPLRFKFILKSTTSSGCRR